MIDETDKKILTTLIQKPFIPQKELAKEVGVTTPTIYNRTLKLKKDGIFLGYTPMIAYDKLGYDVTAIINIQIKDGKVKEAAAKFINDPNVCSVYDISGRYDFLVIAKFHNVKELDNWDNKILQETELIERLNTSIAFNTPKESTNTNKIE